MYGYGKHYLTKMVSYNIKLLLDDHHIQLKNDSI